MEKQPNLRYGILIHKLPENLKWEAIKSLEDSVSISVSSVSSVTIVKLGVNIVFDGYVPFYKAITKRVLIVGCIKYNIYPMVTDLTVIGASPFLTEEVLKFLMSSIAPVLDVYLEKDPKKRLTNNFRVIMNHPEIYDIIKMWPIHNFQIPGCNTSFPIKFFCRLCRRNGHTRHQCNGSQQINYSNEKSPKLKFQEERQMYHEELKHTPKKDTEEKRNLIVESYEEPLRLPRHSNNATETKIKDESIIFDENKVSQLLLKKIKTEKPDTHHIYRKQEVESYEEPLRLPRHSNNATETKIKDESIILDENKVSQLLLKKIKIEKPDTHHIYLKQEVESYEESLRLPRHSNNVTETKMKNESIIFEENKVSQLTLKKIKIEKPDTHHIYLQQEGTDNPMRPKIKCSSINDFATESNLKVPCLKNENDSSPSKDFKTPLPDNNVNYSKNVILKRKKPQKCQKFRFSKLIPPNLHSLIPHLKNLFFSKDTFREGIYTKAKMYPSGINSLLHHLGEILQFNLKEMAFRTSQDRRFIIWMDSQFNKIIKEHSKNNPKKDCLSSLNLKKDDNNNTKNEPKCNKLISKQKNRKLKKDFEKKNIRMLIEKRNMHEDTKTQINPQNSYNNKDTLNTFQKNKGKSPQNIKSYPVKRISVENITTCPSVNIDVHKNNKLYSTQEVCAKKVGPNFQEKTDTQKIKKSFAVHTEVDDDKKEVFMRQRISYLVTKTNDHKDFSSATLPKSCYEEQPKSEKVFAKLSPGLLAAVRCSKGILKPLQLKAFLIHVKGKVHVRQMAKNYSLEVNQIIEQLKFIVNKHYHGVRAVIPTTKEISWITELIGRLKAHESCETCRR